MCNTKPDQWDKSFTWKEIKKHSSRDSCWVVIDGLVYDVTDWLQKHPGGSNIVIGASGIDATDIFNAFHSPAIRRKYLAIYLIGRVLEYEITQQTRDFRMFAKSIESSDLMKSSSKFYMGRIGCCLLLLVSSLYMVLQCSNSLLLGAVCPGVIMALFLQQIAFIGHDLGHMAVTHNRALDNALGVVLGNALSGVSLGWWKATHNTHHVFTNSATADPDIQHLPFFALDPVFQKSVYSTYHSRDLNFDSVCTVIVPYQAYMYYVIMAFARVNLYVQSYRFLLGSNTYREERIKTSVPLELMGLTTFAIWFYFVVLQIPFGSWRLIFLFLSHGLAGILHVQITLSHFAMPVLMANPLFDYSFLQHQLLTCLDIDCPPWLDWFHGGLQFQVIHHLFPRAPRENLRQIRDLLLVLINKYGLEYSHLSFIDANKQVLAHLARVGRACRIKHITSMLES